VAQLEFSEFYRSGQAMCLRAVLASVGDRSLAEDLVAEAFTRAWMSWATGEPASRTARLGGPYRLERRNAGR
jgi:DNA-directed RNA polymerase specialized sigma24 family protein